MAHRFALDFDVRDYECDLEGIVNHAVYLHYLEHARHVLLRQQGIDYAVLAQHGISMVVIRAELQYRRSLRSGDRFTVGTSVERASRLTVRFRHDVHRPADGEHILSAAITGTVVNAAGQPSLPAALEALFVALLDSGQQPASSQTP